MKPTFRIWVNGGNTGLDCANFPTALLTVYKREEFDWKGQEVLITADYDNEDGTISKSRKVCLLKKTRYKDEVN